VEAGTRPVRGPYGASQPNPVRALLLLGEHFAQVLNLQREFVECIAEPFTSIKMTPLWLAFQLHQFLAVVLPCHTSNAAFALCLPVRGTAGTCRARTTSAWLTSGPPQEATRVFELGVGKEGRRALLRRHDPGSGMQAASSQLVSRKRVVMPKFPLYSERARCWVFKRKHQRQQRRGMKCTCQSGLAGGPTLGGVANEKRGNYRVSSSCGVTLQPV